MGVLLLRLNSQRAHAAVEVAAFDAQRFGRARHVPLIFLELEQNEILLVGASGLVQRGVWLRRGARTGREKFRRKVQRLDLVLGNDDPQALDQVAPLERTFLLFANRTISLRSDTATIMLDSRS